MRGAGGGTHSHSLSRGHSSSWLSPPARARELGRSTGMCGGKRYCAMPPPCHLPCLPSLWLILSSSSVLEGDGHLSPPAARRLRSRPRKMTRETQGLEEEEGRRINRRNGLKIPLGVGVRGGVGGSLCTSRKQNFESEMSQIIIIWVSSAILLRRLESVIQSSGVGPVTGPTRLSCKRWEQLLGLLQSLCSPAHEELCTTFQGILEGDGLHYMNNHLPLALSPSSEASLAPPELCAHSLCRSTSTERDLLKKSPRSSMSGLSLRFCQDPLGKEEKVKGKRCDTERKKKTCPPTRCQTLGLPLCTQDMINPPPARHSMIDCPQF